MKKNKMLMVAAVAATLMSCGGGGGGRPNFGDNEYPVTTAAKSLQSCPTLCNPIDGSPPGSPVPGILQQEHWSG